MKTSSPQNKAIRLIIMIIAIPFIIWSVYQEKKPQKTDGELEFRLITGIQQGDFQVIMFETADRFFVLDSAFKQSFENNDAEIVTRREQLQLLSSYKDLQYRAGFSIGENDLKKEVRLSREMFNQLPFKKRMSIKIHSKVQDSLISISGI
ncbi:MAG: hypothetical protein KAH17_04230 [Bacteroidales bacterium]|nr:hypothetical protein [Bacteroidales bacterium]